MDNAEFILHRAPWVIPIGTPPLADGAILVRGDTVVSVGPYNSVRKDKPAGASCIEHDSAALIPGLVNAHTHLELSALRGKIPLPRQSFADWVKELFFRRTAVSPADAERSALEARGELLDAGVALYGDVGNGILLSFGAKESRPARHAFLEALGFNQHCLSGALEPGSHEAFEASAPGNPAWSFAAHACYSTSAAVIQTTKAWCRERDRAFSIHVSEHVDEIEFLRDGTGFCRTLLESLGKWVPEWRPPSVSPVQYLKGLGVLDPKTLLVHCVHMTDSDWETVREHGCSVCFCPRSNANINGGECADVPRAIEAGVAAALGTDSLASNTDLDLFSEGTFLLEKFPALRPRDVLSMMTLGGARALGYASRFGTIESGRSAILLAVSLPSSLPPHELIERILYQGKEGAIRWVK